MKYKILHVPSLTFLKTYSPRVKYLVLEPTFSKIFSAYGNSIWSTHELDNASNRLKSNFETLKLPTKELAEIYLQVYIKGIKKSVYFSNEEEKSLYSQENFYDLIKEEE